MLLWKSGYSGMSLLRAVCLSSKVLGANCSYLNLLTSNLRSDFWCASELARPLTAPQLSISFLMLSSSILQRMASSFCLRILRRVLCLTSLMFSYAIMAASAFGSSLYFLYLSTAFYYYESIYSSASWASSSCFGWTMFCWRSSSCTTIFSF